MEKIDSRQIVQQWQLKSNSENQQINVEYLQQYVCKFEDLNLIKKTWIFSHIPKTAGTSLENYLAQLFLIQDTIHVNAPDLNKLPELLHFKNQFPRFIAGHHPMHGALYQLLPKNNIVHMTMLREPIRRVLSYYNYLSSHENHALHSVVAGKGLDEFLQQPMVEIHNGQSRRLTGLLHSDEKISDSELFESAKSIIDNCFTFVGVTERLEAFIKIIEQKTGVEINRTARKNPSKIILKLKDLNNSQLEKIKNNNAADIMLYEYVLDKFTKIKNAFYKT